MDDNPILPALRPLDVAPVEGPDGEVCLALSDMARISPQPIAVSPAAYFIIAQFNGENSVRDVQRAFEEQFGDRVAEEQILELAATLDDLLMFQNERFEEAYAELADAYRQGDARDSRENWPDADVLRDELNGVLTDVAVPSNGDVVGVVAPHLDYERGAPCYAMAYGALRAAAPAKRYIILGANHAGRSPVAVTTTKDFVTPLGRVKTDRDFIRRLDERLGRCTSEEEFDHVGEHSIELQVQALQHCLGDSDFSIVPVLCPDPMVETLFGMEGAATLTAFADALAALLKEDATRTVVVVGADLSHVGQRFGDEEPSTLEFLADVEASDRELLGLLTAGDQDGFRAKLEENGNPTRVCSVGPLYVGLRALAGRACELLGYHQAVDFETETHVTCAAAVIR